LNGSAVRAQTTLNFIMNEYNIDMLFQTVYQKSYFVTMSWESMHLGKLIITLLVQSSKLLLVLASRGVLGLELRRDP
jgi:hypothetical protein